MGVHSQHDVLDATHVVGNHLDQRAVLVGQAVARGVGHVDDGGAGLHGRLSHLHEEVHVGTTGILGIELDVVHQAARVCNRLGRTRKHFVFAHVQLVLHVRGRDTDAGDDAWARRRLEGLSRRVDVRVNRTRECTDYSSVTHGGAYLGHSTEVARARHGEACLDDVDAHAH